MLNSAFAIKMMEPYLNSKREISSSEFRQLFSSLSNKEQYEIINIMIAHDIYYVEKKTDEISAAASKKSFDSGRGNSMLRLSNEELCVMYQQGDADALSALLAKNKRFVYQYALKMKKQFSKSALSEEDFFQEGMIGVVRAAKSFDASLEYSFLTYSGYWIAQHMSRAAIENGFPIRLPVHVYEKIVKIARYRKLYPMANEKELLDILSEEDAFTPGLSMDQLHEYIQYQELYLNVTSLNVLIGEEDSELIDFIEDKSSDSVEDEVEKSVLVEETNRVLQTLSPREKNVLERRYGLNGNCPQTLEAIAKDYDLTRERIRQIEAKALKKLKRPADEKYIQDLLN